MVKNENYQMTQIQKHFLDGHVAKYGYFFIIDALEKQFDLNKKDAIAIYEAYRKTHQNREAEKALGYCAKKLADAFKNQL